MNSRTPCRLLALLLLASVMAAQLEKANAVPAERLPRTVADLFPDDEEAWQPDEIDAVAVEGAEVVLADYALLRQDFPDQLGELGDDGIRQWLLTHTALMRVEQLNASVQEMELHTAIPVDEDRTRALHSSGRKQYAPFFYGRAMIIEVPGGFIDAKGTGAAAPSLKDHSSGVMRLGGMGAIDEAIYERLTWEVLQLVGSPISTVRTYAVLRLPVSLIPSEELDEGRTGWASNVSKTTHTLGIYLRQVHRKCHDSVFSLACNNLVRHFEHTVRPFGLTSTINYTSFHRQPHLSSDDIADSRNHWAFAPMQCSFNSDIVDFGSYSTRSAFTRKLAQYSLLTSSAAEKYASPPIMTAEESPQPDSCYAVDFDHWGTNEEGIVFDDLQVPSTVLPPFPFLPYPHRYNPPFPLPSRSMLSQQPFIQPTVCYRYPNQLPT